MAGVGVSYFRSRNPNFGGPVHEGARSFLQDFGLNAFVAVLSANVGPKVISALGGETILWIALIGIAGALIPPLVAFWVGIKVFGLNAIISDGAATGGRNSTPSLNAIMEESHSSVAAVPYPVSYAFTNVLALIGGYFSMILSRHERLSTMSDMVRVVELCGFFRCPWIIPHPLACPVAS